MMRWIIEPFKKKKLIFFRVIFNITPRLSKFKRVPTASDHKTRQETCQWNASCGVDLKDEDEHQTLSKTTLIPLLYDTKTCSIRKRRRKLSVGN
jgi:hypothetical protein